LQFRHNSFLLLRSPKEATKNGEISFWKVGRRYGNAEGKEGEEGGGGLLSRKREKKKTKQNSKVERYDFNHR